MENILKLSAKVKMDYRKNKKVDKKDIESLCKYCDDHDDLHEYKTFVKMLTETKLNEKKISKFYESKRVKHIDDVGEKLLLGLEDIEENIIVPKMLY